MERGSGREHMPASLHLSDLGLKSNPWGSIYFDTLIGMNSEKPSGQSNGCVFKVCSPLLNTFRLGQHPRRAKLTKYFVHSCR